MSASTMTYRIIGWNRYRYNGREGFYLNVIEDYKPDAEGDSGGSTQKSIQAPYAESKKIEGVPMSADAPAIIVFKASMQTRGRSDALVCDEILSIAPALSTAKAPLHAGQPADKQPRPATP